MSGLKLTLKLVRHATIDYPSGSALEFYNNQLYVIGDDSNFVLCLDRTWKPAKKIELFHFEGQRIPKSEKPDFECATIINDNLYVFGSGSKSPQRDVAFKIHLIKGTVAKVNTSLFYSFLREKELIAEMNFEGFTICKKHLLFFNRGNTNQPNQLVITDLKVLDGSLPDQLKVIPVNIKTLFDIPLGISGACYDEEQDILFLSASAERTNNAYDDGEIVGSVLAVVYEASTKMNGSELVMDEVIELDKIDIAFMRQKIESICITKAEGKDFTCTLVADNDDGKSVLFEVEIG